MTDFNATMEHWLTRILTSATWSKFEKEMCTALVTYLSNIFQYGALGLICSDAEWAALPGITANGVVAPKPSVPPIPPQPAPSDGTAADDRRYDRERKETTRLEVVREDIVAICRSVKHLLLNPDLGDDCHSVAMGDGDMYAQINEGPDAPYARLKTHLGTPDRDTFRIWSAVYSTPADNIAVSEWMRQDIYANTLLTIHRQQLSENQRLAAFRLCYEKSPPVVKAWEDYCVLTPLLADQNLTDALAYIKRQEPNIRGRMLPADIGFPPLAAVAEDSRKPAENAPALGAAVAPQMYTQAQLDKAVEQARGRSQPAHEGRPPRRDNHRELYCWLHGFQRSHTGHDCTGIITGRPIRAFRRDSRAPTNDTTTVFDHSNCGHQPKCISVAEAQAATGPSSRHHAPGNAIRSGAASYDGSR